MIIGARSALFAPTERLGLIIIDEEHDGAYKSDTSPKHHATKMGVHRQAFWRGKCCLRFSNSFSGGVCKSIKWRI